MSKRLQVLLDDAEYRELRRLARGQGMTVSQWVRRALQAVQRQEPSPDTGRKLAAVREAARFTYPTAPIDEMLADIERGYQSGFE